MLCYDKVDDNKTEGYTYTYYIAAYKSNNNGAEEEEEIYRTNEVTIDAWLLPCSLVSPQDGANIPESTPTFTWNPVGDFAFSNSSIKSGKSEINVFNATSKIQVWQRYFDDMTTSSVAYNDDNSATTSLVSGEEYTWRYIVFGYDCDDVLIAESYSQWWSFKYNASEE